MKIHNFSAGPSILPSEVFQKCSEAILNFNNSGLFLTKILTLTKRLSYVAMSANKYKFEQAVALVKKTANISDDYEVLFLQGGASLQFVMAPYNLMKEGGSASYLDTGSWSSAAIKEAKKFGTVNVVASS